MTQTDALQVVIMAGGAGTRFWPASRVARPKQLLDLLGEQTMIQATVARVGDLAGEDRIRIITNRQLVDPICQQLPHLPPGAVLGEPCKRDTAPCIGWAALQAIRQDPDATMVVMPADHVIEPVESFRASIRLAARMVAANPDRLVTFGIRPTYPAEVYGYIQRGEVLRMEDTEFATYRVARFREKPDRDTAADYLASGEYFWNAGIFVWKARTILEALREWSPEIYQHLVTIEEAFGTPEYERVLDEEFGAMVGKSIDYAVMERYGDVAMIEAPYAWDDVGNWQALARLRGTDADGNTIIGRQLNIDTRNSILCTDQQHLLVTVGITDCIVVHTGDATLIAQRRDEEALRQIVPQLRERGWEAYL